jgi:hypothetical protein
MDRVPDVRQNDESVHTDPGDNAVTTLPEGWPVSSYDTYKEAQQTSTPWQTTTSGFGGVTIVGLDPVLVERVGAHLTWRRVPPIGALSGA